MTGRAIGETLVALALTALLALLGAGMFEFIDGNVTLAEAFFVRGPQFVGPLFGIPFALWGVALIVGNLRSRLHASGKAYRTNQMSAIVIAVVAAIAWSVFGALQGGWGLLLGAIALFAAIIFVVATIPALLLTHFAFFRHGAAEGQGTADGPASGPAEGGMTAASDPA